MTANQIAAESNRIQRDISANQLAETQRHNKEVEAIQAEANQLTAERNDIEREYKKFQENWAREYEAKWRDYQLAQEDMRISIQGDLAKLEERKVLTEEDYKRRMATNAELLAGMEQRRIDIDEEFKEFQKSAKWQELGLTEKDVETRRKAVEYEAAMKHEYNVNYYALGKEQNRIAENLNVAKMDLSWANLNWEREKLTKSLTNEINIAQLTYGMRQQELALQRERFESIDKDIAKAQAFQAYSGSLFGRNGIIPGSLETVKDAGQLITMFGGFNATATPKQIAQALFK